MRKFSNWLESREPTNSELKDAMRHVNALYGPVVRSRNMIKALEDCGITIPNHLRHFSSEGNDELERMIRDELDKRESSLKESRYSDFDDDRSEFANPGSALRRSTKRNPRIHPCPTCKQPNKLTPADVSRGYQCDDCADRDEGLSW